MACIIEKSLMHAKLKNIFQFAKTLWARSEKRDVKKEVGAGCYQPQVRFRKSRNQNNIGKYISYV